MKKEAPAEEEVVEKPEAKKENIEPVSEEPEAKEENTEPDKEDEKKAE